MIAPCLTNAMVSFDIPEQRALFASFGFLAAVLNLHHQAQAEQLDEVALEVI